MINTFFDITVGQIKGPGTGPLANPGANSGTLFGNFLSGAIGVLTIIAAIWFLFKIVLGGMAIINSDGDQKAVETARGSITYGVVGLVVIISATFIVGIVGYLLGIDNLLKIDAWINTIAR